jgi:hypothetical protein
MESAFMRARCASRTAYSASWIAAAAKSIGASASPSAHLASRSASSCPVDALADSLDVGVPVALHVLPATLGLLLRRLYLGTQLLCLLVGAPARGLDFGLELCLALRCGRLDVRNGLVDLGSEPLENGRPLGPYRQNLLSS